MNRRLVLILVYVFIDVLGFSLILPLLPYYAEQFQASPSLVGLLLGANAVTQLIGAPLIGRLSDRYGRRPMLLLSIGGTVASFLVLGLARSLWMLFLSRILDGFLGGNISLAQAYITDVTDRQNRARGLGLVGAAFGVGFTFGPAIGGTLSADGNYALPALLAAGLSFLNLLGVFLFIPESLPAEQRQSSARSTRPRVNLASLMEALRRPCVGPLLQFQLLYGLAFTMFQTIFALFVQKRLGLGARSTSYLLTYVGILVVIVQGGGIGLLTKRFQDRPLLLAGSALMALALFAWAFTPSVWFLLIVLIPLALSGGMLNVVSNSALTKSVRPEEVGGTLGIAAALGSLARAISPIAGGFLIDAFGTATPGIVGAVLMVWLVFLSTRHLLQLASDTCPVPAE